MATSMDGVKDDISGHFKTIYSTLYNSVDDQEELMNVAQETESRINSLSNLDVEKVTPDVVKEAASHLRDSKSDPTYSFNSDCIKNLAIPRVEQGRGVECCPQVPVTRQQSRSYQDWIIRLPVRLGGMGIGYEVHGRCEFGCFYWEC